MNSVSLVPARAQQPDRIGFGDEIIERIPNWFTFEDFGLAARRHVAIAWSCLGVLLLADIAWMPVSRLSFAGSNWSGILNSAVAGLLALAMCLAITRRLRDQTDRVGRGLWAAANCTELLWRSGFVVVACCIVGLPFTYLATAAAWPLRDGVLVALDSQLGFNWLEMLVSLNEHSVLAALLVKAYQSTGFAFIGSVLWLSIAGRGERLAELLAILCMSLLGLCVGMLIAPAAGAFAYYQPSPAFFSHFGSDLWPFFRTFSALRNGQLAVIDFAAADGIVSFPSFHTVLGMITTYAVRDARWLLASVAVLSATMIVSTLPVGGHHLVDVLAGAVIAVAAILIARIASGNQLPDRRP